jgi:hypothetical protein
MGRRINKIRRKKMKDIIPVKGYVLVRILDSEEGVCCTGIILSNTDIELSNGYVMKLGKVYLFPYCGVDIPDLSETLTNLRLVRKDDIIAVIDEEKKCGK